MTEPDDIKISFTLPKWAIGKNITVFANTELIASLDFRREKKDGKVTEYYAPLRIKTARCNGCGECCGSGSPFTIDHIQFLRKALNQPLNPFLPCPFLTKDGCGLGGHILFSCAWSYCGEHFKNCSERME